ncbi:MAG: NYN domain-containing protein [Calditrichia bacterium]|nr:NYN domain-containing protein [Calditrichia bacterium]
MQTTYLIDVFNLLYKWSVTKTLMKNNQLIEAEQIFLNKVLSFSKCNNCTFHLFFDGMNLELARKWNYPKMKIIFCHPQTADEKIKSFINNTYKKNKHNNKIITVTDDHELVSYSRRFDYKVMNIDNFLILLKQSSSAKSSKSQNINEKPDSVTDADIEEYLHLMKEDNKKSENKNYE